MLFLLWFSLTKFAFRPPRLLKPPSRVYENEPLPTEGEKSVKEHLSYLDICKIPNSMHLGVQRELADRLQGCRLSLSKDHDY